MCRARRGGPRTPSTTTDANLNCAFVENALIYVIVKSQQNTIELVTRPGTLQSSVEHIETLLNRGYRDPPYPIPSMARASERTLVCTICKYTASNEGCLRTHLRHHMKEAHDAVLKCETCSSQFDSTIDYFKHLPQHKLNSRTGH